MGIKEGACHDEYQVMCGMVKSLYCIPESNIILYVNHINKIKTIFKVYILLYINNTSIQVFFFFLQHLPDVMNQNVSSKILRLKP